MKNRTQRLGILALAIISCTGAASAAETAAAPGARPALKLAGKVGEDLSSGQWQLRIVSVARAATYDSRMIADPTTTRPEKDGDEVVAVEGTITNSGKEALTPMLSWVHPNHTALIDSHGVAYAPITFDKEGGHTDEGLLLEPGAGTSFVALFSVPKGATLTALTFSLQTAFDDYPDGGRDVRVELGK